jgi:hypothetical protein
MPRSDNEEYIATQPGPDDFTLVDYGQPHDGLFNSPDELVDEDASPPRAPKKKAARKPRGAPKSDVDPVDDKTPSYDRADDGMGSPVRDYYTAKTKPRRRALPKQAKKRPGSASEEADIDVKDDEAKDKKKALATKKRSAPQQQAAFDLGYSDVQPPPAKKARTKKSSTETAPSLPTATEAPKPAPQTGSGLLPTKRVDPPSYADVEADIAPRDSQLSAQLKGWKQISFEAWSNMADYTHLVYTTAADWKDKSNPTRKRVYVVKQPGVGPKGRPMVKGYKSPYAPYERTSYIGATGSEYGHVYYGPIGEPVIRNA